MIGDIFAADSLIFLAIFTAIAAVIALIFNLTRDAAHKRSWGALFLETLLLTVVGGLLARSFIALLLSFNDNSDDWGLLLGWAFFMWPGAIDSVIRLTGGTPTLASPEALLWIATAIGAFTGMMDGLWQSRKWAGLGVLTFLLDLTWGIVGTTNGALLHLVNFAWAGHADTPEDCRRDNHRYRSGFRFKSGYAFTQGPVMSNLHSGPGSELWNHENTHVLQNRIFGPFFSLTYLAWMAIMVIPSAIVAAVKRYPVGAVIMAWCYLNLPWEVWAYKVGGDRHRLSPIPLWKDWLVIVAAIIYFGAVFASTVLLLDRI